MITIYTPGEVRMSGSGGSKIACCALNDDGSRDIFGDDMVMEIDGTIGEIRIPAARVNVSQSQEGDMLKVKVHG